MTAIGPALEPDRLAGSILDAVRDGSLAAVVSQLERAERSADCRDPLGSHAAEQWDLLEAVSGQMRRSISRFQRRLTPHLEGTEVHLRLLHHLARTPCATPIYPPTPPPCPAT